MTQPPTDVPAHCINPDCRHPHSFASRVCPSCGTSLRLGDRYIPLQQLSSGRYTTTHTVYDLKTKQEAVLKVVIEATPDTVRLFQQDAKVLAGLRHPGLPKVEVGSYFQIPIKFPKTRMLPCFVMEQVSGKSLQAVLEDYPKGCPETWVKDWLLQAVKALRFVHDRQVVHGNLKPENMLLRPSGQLVLVGFGSARRLYPLGGNAQSSGPRSWAQGYQLPELHAAGVTPLMDVYALGRICIHLLTGTHPILLEDRETGKLRWRDKARVSKPFAELVDSMVQLSGLQRLQTIAAVQAALAKLPDRQNRFAPKSWAERQQPKPASVHRRSLTQFVAPVQTIESAVEASLGHMWELGLGCQSLLRTMMQVGGGGAIGAGLGFWLVYWSPIAPQIWQLFTTLPLLVHRSMVLNPVILMFVAAGLGSMWAGIQLPSEGRPHRLWSASLLGGVGYGLGWLSWQWITREQSAQAFARIAAIAACFLALELCSQRPRLLHAIAATVGTSVTFSLLIRSKLLNINALYTLFPDTAVGQLAPDTATLTMSLIFFGILGGVACFWLQVSQQAAQIVAGLRRD